MEMHILHYYKGTDGMLGAIIGIFFDTNEEKGGSSDFLDSLFSIVDLPDDNISSGTVRMLDFLQNVDFSSYWNYNGSLTTPPCQEGIKWTVISDVQPLSVKQLERIQKSVGEFGNSRAIQQKTNM